MKSAQKPASFGAPALARATRPIATSGTAVFGKYSAIDTRAPTCGGASERTAIPKALSSREVVCTATPSDTYRTGMTKLDDGIGSMTFKRHAADRARSSASLQDEHKVARGQIPGSRPENWPSHNTLEASSASAERSPLVRVMCPASRSCLNLLTTWTRPLLVEST